MSVNNVETEVLENEVVVNEVETTELVDKEAKKAKLLNVGKKVLKVAGVLTVGAIGYFLGTKASNTTECYEEVEEIADVEAVDSDAE